MIVLDTNVISELVRPKPDEAVLRWAYSANSGTMYTTAICQAELLAGMALMPLGRRRAELVQGIDTVLSRAFGDKILPFDSNAARHYATVIVKRKTLGRPIKEADAQIAAICLARSATIVTRDRGGFDYLGLKIFNPWTD